MKKLSFGSIEAAGTLLEFKISEISRYLNSIDTYLITEFSELGDRLDEQAKDLSPEIKQEFYEFHCDEIVELREDFPRFLFSGFILLWHAMVEDELQKIYKDLKQKKPKKASSGNRRCIFVDIRRKLSQKTSNENKRWEIKDARKLIKEVSGYEINLEHWQELKRIGKVRNQLAHRGVKASFKMSFQAPKLPNKKVRQIEAHGNKYFVDIDQDFYQYVSRHDIFRFSGIFRLEPNLKYCNHLITFGSNIFSKIISDLSGSKIKIRGR